MVSRSMTVLEPIVLCHYGHHSCTWKKTVLIRETSQFRLLDHIFIYIFTPRGTENRRCCHMHRRCTPAQVSVFESHRVKLPHLLPPAGPFPRHCFTQSSVKLLATAFVRHLFRQTNLDGNIEPGRHRRSRFKIGIILKHAI